MRQSGSDIVIMGKILLPVATMAALLSTCGSLGQGKPVAVITKETHPVAGNEHFIMSLDN